MIHKFIIVVWLSKGHIQYKLKLFWKVCNINLNIEKWPRQLASMSQSIRAYNPTQA